jgi:uncharacterized membrane protein
MTAKTALLAAAIGGLVAITAVQTTFAADDTATEKCYGIAKAGKNDCAGAKHACAGQGTKERASSEWIKLPKGTCERIAGAKLTAAAK